MALRIASETDPPTIARRQAETQYRRAIRSLAANILRVIRGAGRPLTIVEELKAVAKALATYESAFGYPPGAEHQEWLAAGLPEVSPEYGDFACEWRDGEKQIIAGALQRVASVLAEQPMHEAAGEKQMTAGIYQIERIREEARRERAREARAAKAKAKPVAKRRPSAKPKRPVSG